MNSTTVGDTAPAAAGPARGDGTATRRRAAATISETARATRYSWAAAERSRLARAMLRERQEHLAAARSRLAALRAGTLARLTLSAREAAAGGTDPSMQSPVRPPR